MDEINATVSTPRSSGTKSAIGIVADVTSHSQVEDMVAQTVDTFGPLKVLVANAGISKIKPLLEQSEQDMRTMMEVNTMGVWHCYTIAARQMVKQLDQGQVEKGENNGKIIGAASLAALRPFLWLGHYAASKHAVRGLTQSLALEIAEKGITANSYAPGIVDTPMWAESDIELGRRQGKKPRQALEELRGTIALKRLSTGEDVAKTVSFLAGPDSDYMTGQCLAIDGGVFFH